MNADRIIDARHAKKLQSEVEHLKSQLTQTQGCVTISRNGYVQELERELAEAREETIRTREFMDYGFAKAQEELATVTEQRDRLIKAVEPLEYWRDISECDCSSPLPQGGCLRCDLNRVLKTTNPNEP